MNSDQPNNAIHNPVDLLETEDVGFIHRILGSDLVSIQELTNLLRDDDMRQDILDSRCIYNAISDEFDSLQISLYFYLYIVIRQILLSAELEEPRYTEETVAAYIKMCRLQQENGEEEPDYHYPDVNLQILREETPSGEKVRIAGKLDRFLIVLQSKQEADTPSEIPFNR